jgi:hypothetical protein
MFTPQASSFHEDQFLSNVLTFDSSFVQDEACLTDKNQYVIHGKLRLLAKILPIPSHIKNQRRSFEKVRSDAWGLFPLFTFNMHFTRIEI